MRIGLFGGSFDPIHRGHVEPIREAATVLGLDRVLYLPTGRPPHKGERIAPAHARYTMVELAILGEEGLFASPFELRDDRPSYTVDTVSHFVDRFRQEDRDAEVVYLIGGDSWETFTTWREWRRILELAELAVLVRPEADPTRAGERALDEPFRSALAAGRLHFVPNRPVEVSSTEIREALGRGEVPADAALAPLVLDYIRKYGLYRTP